EGCNTGAMTDGNTGAPTGPRHGITIPFDGVTLEDHRRWYEELVRLGYTDVWSAETDGVDGFTPLALASAWTPSLRLGVAIIPALNAGGGRHHAGLHAGAAPAGPECRGPGRGGTGPLHVRPGHLVGGDREQVERDRIRRALQTGPRHDPLPPVGPGRREGGTRVRDLHRAGFPAGSAGGAPAADLPGGTTAGDAATSGTRGRWRHPQLAVRRGRGDGEAGTGS